MRKKGILLSIFFVLLLITALYLLVPILTGSTKLLVVLSGSMHPMMRVGDMVVVNTVSPEELVSGDVMAFKDPGGRPNTLITHRIISIKEGKERVFQTKGDANEEKDNFVVPASDVVGKLVFVLPFAGYLPKASKNSLLFCLMILLPSVLIVLDELRNIIEYSNPARARKYEKEQKRRARYTSYVVKEKALLWVLMISLLIPAGLVLPNLENNRPLVLGPEQVLKNTGSFPVVFVITPEDPGQRLMVEPWYGVVEPGNETLIRSGQSMPVEVSSVPYILPVFWVILLAGHSPSLPSAAAVMGYAALLTVFLLPLWYRKTTHGVHKKNLRRTFSEFKRALRRAFT